jgi:ABC-type hemin transport system ATPase subunit
VVLGVSEAGAAGDLGEGMPRFAQQLPHALQAHAGDLVVRGAAERGAAVLLSTHLLAEAAAVCDRVVVIAGGRVLAEEQPGDAVELEARFLRLVGEAGLT